MTPALPANPWKTALATSGALLAFAANSLLCRWALGPERIDAASFTAVRIVAGAAVLALLMRAARDPSRPFAGTWPSGAALFVYAIAFSLAYMSLPAGIGALVLFGSVQATMIGWGLLRGERPRGGEWLGLVLAIVGLVALVITPGMTAPPVAGALLMALAGAAWGVYSLRGRGVVDPIAATADNFLCAAPLSLLALLVLANDAHVSLSGLALAALSGAITSGLGYVVWYHALPGLTATRAATVQLAVPVLTALAAVVLLREPLSLRLVGASVFVLGGVALAVFARQRK